MNRRRVMPDGLSDTLARVLRQDTPEAHALARHLLDRYDALGTPRIDEQVEQVEPLPNAAVYRSFAALSICADLGTTYGDEKLWRLALDAIRAYADSLLE